MAEPSNLLRHETSPYLLQHADNPVHWRPWGQAALHEAAERDKPILLSIGYAACHWCHVMAHESFEDPATAALMNELFVSIKVDREERPDIDHIYMTALHALGEQGGWPLTMFLTPDGAPFWGGTYFPPEPRWGRPSFRQVLQAVAEAYRNGHEMVDNNAGALRRALSAMAKTRTGGLLTPAHLDRAAASLLSLLDPVQGGLRGAPKFPNPPFFRFLWQNAFRTGAPDGADALHLMLTRMSQGGIYDHLGGGFARYSTDAIWLVPHFEKMLYDNAQLLELLAFAYAARPDPLYAARASETVGWLDRDMTAADAAFAASEDADSEGEEGKFYVWTEAEIDLLLGKDAALFKQAYDVTPTGNWEGKTILRRVTEPDDLNQESALARMRAALFEARAKRVRPGRDDKILADWNGLTIAALARAAAVFEKPQWLARAEKAFDFILAHMSAAGGRVQHAWRLGRVTAAGLLDDQAAMARAALALFEATGNPQRLEHAIRIVNAASAFGNGADADAFYTTAADADDVPVARPRVATDNATPAGNGLMAEVFARLYHLTGDPRWRRSAEGIIRAFSGAEEALSTMSTVLAAADFLEDGATVVIAGASGHPLTQALTRTALAAADPAVVVLRAPEPTTLPAQHPAHGKRAGPSGAAAYLCRRDTCGRPIDNVAALSAALKSRAQIAPA